MATAPFSKVPPPEHPLPLQPSFGVPGPPSGQAAFPQFGGPPPPSFLSDLPLAGPQPVGLPSGFSPHSPSIGFAPPSGPLTSGHGQVPPPAPTPGAFPPPGGSLLPPGGPPLDVGGFLLPLPLLHPPSGTAVEPLGLPLLDNYEQTPPLFESQATLCHGGQDETGEDSVVFGPALDPGADLGDVVAEAATPKPAAKAPPPWVPPWAASVADPDAVNRGDAGKKRKRVEGLAPSKNIASGGAVTIYSGYSALTTGGPPQAGEAPANAEGAAARASAAAAATASTGGPPQAALASTTAQALPRQLPEGWEMRKSRSTGKVYYVNEKLGKSQFDPPAGSTLKVEQKKKQKMSMRAKDGPDAHVTDKNGLAGMVRAAEQKLGRWQKWQKTSRIINAPSPDKD